MNLNNISFKDVVLQRHSTRGFLPDPIPRNTLKEILQEAQYSPSNCNTQPWSIHIVSGDKLNELSSLLLNAFRQNNYTLDFSFDINDYPDIYKQRAVEQGGRYYQALGVARSDSLTRREIVERNVHFFGAPHVAFLFFPSVGDNVRVASDIGMYAQTLLLSLTAHGYAGVPQTILGTFADTIRKALDISHELKLLFGISFGIADKSHASSHYQEGRIPIEESIIWY